MKRYVVFGYDVYYPSGGLNDVIDSFDSIEEIDKFFIQKINNKNKYFSRCDNYQVLDIQTGSGWEYELPI